MNGIETTLRVIDEVDVRRDDLDSWAAASGSSELASFYLPTHRGGREVAQDPVLFRQLVASAAEEVAHGDLLVAATRLIDDREFWSHGSASLAVLAGPDATTAIRLSEPTGALAVVSDRFHLKPLVAALARHVEFDVLAISRHGVRLVTVTGSRAVEAEVPGLPSSMSEALRWDDREPQLQSHSGSRSGRGLAAAAFHGQGSTSDARDVDLDRFVHLIDHALVDHRAGSTRPLVLAGVDDIVAVYRKLTHCAHVVDGHVAGSPDQLRPAELADRARRLVPPPAVEVEQTARESFLAGAAATVRTVEQAVIAAAAGQVASIFVPGDREYWGRYRPGHRLLEEHETRGSGDHDLSDVAAIETLRHGGAAFVVPDSDIPGGGTAAATLRY